MGRITDNECGRWFETSGTINIRSGQGSYDDLLRMAREQGVLTKEGTTTTKPKSRLRRWWQTETPIRNGTILLLALVAFLNAAEILWRWLT